MSAMTAFDRRSTAMEVLRGIRLEGRVVLVTGANAGIGFETARALSAHGARTYLGCRDASAGKSAADRIFGEHPGADVRVLSLDLGRFASIRQAVESFDEKRVDLVVCNAGVYGPYAETADGFERTVGVCHLGHFLLVSLLRERLRAAAPSRVVVVSSESHRHPKTLDFSRFPVPRARYRSHIAYGQAKLCNVLFACELSRRWGSDGVLANALHPGTLVKTSIGRNSGLAAAVLWLAQPFAKSLGQAAATSVFCATASTLENTGGHYFVDCQERKASAGGLDATVAARLWEVSERWTGLG
jgi:WW domain-containing oxidoreductase